MAPLFSLVLTQLRQLFHRHLLVQEIRDQEFRFRRLDAHGLEKEFCNPWSQFI